MMRFYCTAGRGTETFVRDELTLLFRDNLEQVVISDGKVFFTVSQSTVVTLTQLLSLKSPERLFVQVLHSETGLQDRRALLTILHTQLNNRAMWAECISTIRRLHTDIAKTPKLQKTVGDDLDCEHKDLIDLSKSEKAFNHGLTDKDVSDLSIRHGIAVHTYLGEQKTKHCNSEISDNITVSGCLANSRIISQGLLDKSENSHLTASVLEATPLSRKLSTRRTLETLKTRDMALSATRVSEENSVVEIISQQTHDKLETIDTGLNTVNEKLPELEMVKQSRPGLNAASDFNNELPELEVVKSRPVKRSIGSFVHDADSASVSTVKKQRTINTQRDVTFRVSCKFSGSVRHKLNYQKTSKQMGVLISKLMGWKTDLCRNPQMEICIHMNDEVLTVGVPLSSEPLSKRSYIKHFGLRSTVAWIMAHLIHVQPGDTVVDPMCGQATILLEAGQICKDVTYIGMDKDTSQLGFAAENLVLSGQWRCTSLIHGDTRNIPLADSSVDKVVTDAPFGQNHTTDTDIHIFYTAMLTEISRILKSGGDIVLLTSPEMRDDLYQRLYVRDQEETDSCPGSGQVSTKLVRNSVEKNSILVSYQVETKTGENSTSSDTYLRNCDQSNTGSADGSTAPRLDSHLEALLTFKQSFYVKLGNTDAHICMLQNREKLK